MVLFRAASHAIFAGCIRKGQEQRFLLTREEHLTTNVPAFQRVDLPVSKVMGLNRDGWNRKQSMGGR